MSFTSGLIRNLMRAGARPNRADTSLLGGAVIQFGNQISNSEHKTRRTWKPNVHDRKLFSRVLNEHFRLSVTSQVLRTIDKKGGLDAYLLTTTDSKIDSRMGIALKNRILASLNVKKTPAVNPLP
jgi:large subunit ribosomal protein L28